MYSLRRLLKRAERPRHLRQHFGSQGPNVVCLEDGASATSVLGHRGKIRRPLRGTDIELLELRTPLTAFTVPPTSDGVDAGDREVLLCEANTSANAHSNSGGPGLIGFNLAAGDAWQFYDTDRFDGRVSLANRAATTASDDSMVLDSTTTPSFGSSWMAATLGQMPMAWTSNCSSTASVQIPEPSATEKLRLVDWGSWSASCPTEAKTTSRRHGYLPGSTLQ